MNKGLFYLVVILFLIACSEDKPESDIDKFENIQIEQIKEGVKISWKDSHDDRSEYNIYSVNNNKTKQIGYTQNKYFIDTSPILGENVYKIEVNSNNSQKIFSESVRINVNSFNFVASYQNDIKALYAMKQANTNSNLGWQFHDLDSETPTVSNYTVKTDDTEYDQLKFDDVNGEKRLVSLDLENMNISDLTDISKLRALKHLKCSTNSLHELIINKNTALETLDCSKNSLTNLDLRSNKKISWVICSQNQLLYLGIDENNNQLSILFCLSNKLATLDTHRINGLTSLLCSDNSLSKLDVKNHKKLATLSCSSNQLTELDISNNLSLKWISAAKNLFVQKSIKINEQVYNSATLSPNKNVSPELYNVIK